MAEENFRVRSVSKKDFPEWLRLRKSLWDETGADEHHSEMRDIFEHTETQLVLVAELENEQLVGFLEVSIRPFVEDCDSEQVGYLEGWFVQPEFRQHSIGKVLVKTAEEWARQKGCEEMASDAEIGNDLSLKIHLNLGYEETSRLVHLRKDLV